MGTSSIADRDRPSDPAKAEASSGNRKIWFVALWLVWAALLAGAMIAGNTRDGHGSPPAVWLRMGSSIALAFTSLFSWVLWRRTTVGRFVSCLAIGMTFGTIGDFFNAGLLSFVPLPNPVLGGIAAFGLGHAAYIYGTLDLSRRNGFTDRSRFAVAIVGWQLFALVAWYFVCWMGTRARGLVWPSLPYSALLAGTAGVTSGLAWQAPRYLGLAIGGALFLASDLILAYGMFYGQIPHQSEWVWLTYGPGQMLIVYSALSAADALRNQVANGSGEKGSR